MLDYLPRLVEAKDVDSCGFLSEQVQVTHMDKGQITIDGDAFHLAAKAASLLEEAHNSVETVRNEWIVLNVRSGYEIRIQVGAPLVEDLVVDDVEHLSDVISFHNSEGMTFH